MRHMAQTDPERLTNHVERVKDQWQIAVDERNRLQKSNGSHAKPKRRGLPDAKSFEHSAKDTTKFSAAGVMVFLGVVGEQVIDKIWSGDIDIVDAIFGAIQASGDWGLMIAGLAGAYFIMLIALKALKEYP